MSSSPATQQPSPTPPTSVSPLPANASTSPVNNNAAVAAASQSFDNSQQQTQQQQVSPSTPSSQQQQPSSTTASSTMHHQLTQHHMGGGGNVSAGTNTGANTAIMYNMTATGAPNQQQQQQANEQLMMPFGHYLSKMEPMSPHAQRIAMSNAAATGGVPTNAGMYSNTFPTLGILGHPQAAHGQVGHPHSHVHHQYAANAGVVPPGTPTSANPSGMPGTPMTPNTPNTQSSQSGLNTPGSVNSQAGTPNSVPQKRKINKLACEYCSKLHKKCDGDHPNPCTRCKQKGIPCNYVQRRKRGPKTKRMKTGNGMGSYDSNDMSPTTASSQTPGSPFSANTGSSGSSAGNVSAGNVVGSPMSVTDSQQQQRTLPTELLNGSMHLDGNNPFPLGFPLFPFINTNQPGPQMTQFNQLFPMQMMMQSHGQPSMAQHQAPQQRASNQQAVADIKTQPSGTEGDSTITPLMSGSVGGGSDSTGASATDDEAALADIVVPPNITPSDLYDAPSKDDVKEEGKPKQEEGKDEEDEDKEESSDSFDANK